MEFIGPLKIIYYYPKAKVEAVCHRCGISYFEWTIEKAESMMLRHLDAAHWNPPPPYELKAEEMPGYGSACG